MNLKITFVLALGLTILSSSSMALTRRSIDSERVSYNKDNLLKLNRSIIAEISDDLKGAILPKINLTKNSKIEIDVTQTGSSSYLVNGALKIDLEVIGNFPRKFLFGRYLTVCVLMIRKGGLTRDNDQNPLSS